MIWCQVTSILFTDNGKTLGYTIIEDITEKYQLRQQKEEFISVASHELKTPFTTLKATLQVINRMLNKEDPPIDQLRGLAKNAEKNSEKMGCLIADLLNTTRIEQGQLSLNRTQFSVGQLIDSCCSNIRVEGIYQLKLEGDDATLLFADQQKIEQVIINLVNNAIKYAPNSFVIVIRIEMLPAGVKMTVIDHGPGIAAENISHLFDRYFRVDKSMHRTSGLGLGLYISSEIIRRHGGKMGVICPKAFTTTEFLLPCRGCI